MFKRFYAALMCLALLVAPMTTLAASRGNETLHTFNLDQAGSEAFAKQAYMKGRWIQITATIEGTADVQLKIYTDTDLNPATHDSRVYSKTFKGVSGQFVSPEIELTFKKSATIPHRVELYKNDELIHQAYIYRMLLPLNGNTLTTNGIRFRDYNTAITGKWMMFTPIDFNEIGNDSVKTIDLIASNMYQVGKLHIHRKDNKFQFTIETIDEWNAAHGREEYDLDEPYIDTNDPNFPWDVDHDINISGVRIHLLKSLGDVDLDHLGGTTYKLNEWHTIESLENIHTRALYLYGHISYDPNGLKRIAGEDMKHLQSLLPALQ